MSRAPKALIFDLDGTLIDSARDIQFAANRLMREIGLAEFDLTTTTSFIGNGVRKLVERCLLAQGASLEDLDALTARFKLIYEEDPSSRTIIFEGVHETLARLQKAGLAMAICTNKPERAARIILQNLELLSYFTVLIGGDSTPKMKPDPAPLEAAIAALGVMKTDVCYIGDSQIDVEAARRAGVAMIYYTGGYDNGDAQNAPATKSFQNFHDLLHLLGVAS